MNPAPRKPARIAKQLADFGIKPDEALPQGAKALGGLRFESPVTPQALANALEQSALQPAWDAALQCSAPKLERSSG